MQKKEFEALTGLKTSQEEYTQIERVYMALEDMDKETFCRAWMEAGNRLTEIVREMTYVIERQKALLEEKQRLVRRLMEEQTETAKRLLKMEAEHEVHGEAGRLATELVGISDVSVIKVTEGMALTEQEKAYVISCLV